MTVFYFSLEATALVPAFTSALFPRILSPPRYDLTGHTHIYLSFLPPLDSFSETLQGFLHGYIPRSHFPLRLLYMYTSFILRFREGITPKQCIVSKKSLCCR